MKQLLTENGKRGKPAGGKSPIRVVLILSTALLGILLMDAVLNRAFKVDLFELLKDLFLLKYLPKLGNDVGFGLLFLFGVLTSFHCVGMCGGIAISQTVGGTEKDVPIPFSRLFVPSALYNSGRVVAYTLVGGIVGGLGQVIGFTGIWKSFVPVLGGVFMIVMAVNLLGILPGLRQFRIPVPKILARKVYSAATNSGPKRYGPFVVGLLTGLMPCGPLQMIQIYALGTGNILHGAVSMFFFSIGTVPLLFLFGLINTVINKKHSAAILKGSAVLVLVLGVIMIGRGLALAGVDVGISAFLPEKSVADAKNTAILKGDLQVVETSLEPGSFPAIVVQKGIRVKWNLHADKKNLNECNRAIVVPKLDLEKELKEGDNYIEFLPQEAGVIPYTCWMGMIKSKITVLDRNDNALSRADSADPSSGTGHEGTGQVGKTEEKAASESIAGAALSGLKTSAAEGLIGYPDSKTDAGSMTASATAPVGSSAGASGSGAGRSDSNNPHGSEYQSVSNKPEPVSEETTADGASSGRNRLAAAAEEGKETAEKWLEGKLTPGGKKTQAAENDELWTGWLVDRDCLGVNPLKHTADCNLMDTCYASGMGIIPYIEGKAYTSYSSKEDYIVFDAISRDVARSFLESLPDDWTNNTTVRVKGYLVSNIPANADETNVPEPDSARVDHYLTGIHITSIETFYIEGVSTHKLPEPNLILPKQ